MDRRTFMKLMGGLASMPIVGRIAKPLKSDMDYYYDSDPHIQELVAKIEYQQTLVDTLEEIMNVIRWRHSTIKNIIDWRRFTSGG